MSGASEAKIIEAPKRAGVHWRLPITLLKRDLNGWRIVSRFENKERAQRYARRKGWKMINE